MKELRAVDVKIKHMLKFNYVSIIVMDDIKGDSVKIAEDAFKSIKAEKYS